MGLPRWHALVVLIPAAVASLRPQALVPEVAVFPTAEAGLAHIPSEHAAGVVDGGALESSSGDVISTDTGAQEVSAVGAAALLNVSSLQQQAFVNASGQQSFQERSGNPDRPWFAPVSPVGVEFMQSFDNMAGIELDPKEQKSHDLIALATMSPGYLCVTNNWMLHARQVSNISITLALRYVPGETNLTTWRRMLTSISPVGGLTVLTRSTDRAGAPDAETYWAWRLRVLREMLEVHQMVLLSDCDALWFQDPAPVLLQAAPNEILSSIGVVNPFPKYVSKKWGGFVLCMGFAAFPKAATQLIDKMYAVCVRNVTGEERPCDDQVTLNMMLSGQIADTDWGKARYPLRHRAKVSEWGGLTVSTFSEEYVTRPTVTQGKFVPNSKTAVCHPRGGQHRSSTQEQILRRIGLMPHATPQNCPEAFGIVGGQRFMFFEAH